MTRRRLPTLAALLLAALSATAALADRDLAPLEPSNAAGDWNCRLGDDAIGTLFVRTSSYELTRSGVAMAGEYEQADERVTVVNGPLRGLGIDNGTLVVTQPRRSLDFTTANGAVLTCSEVL